MGDTGSLRVLQGSPGHSEAPSSSSVVSCSDFITVLGAGGSSFRLLMEAFPEDFRRLRDFLGPFKSVVIVMFWGILAFWRRSWNDLFSFVYPGVYFRCPRMIPCGSWSAFAQLGGSFGVPMGYFEFPLGGHMPFFWKSSGRC